MSSNNHTFQILDHVIFRYTGVKAQIIENNMDGSFIVVDETNDEIVAFEEDIVPAEQFSGIEISTYQEKHQKSSQPSIEELFFGEKYTRQKTREIQQKKTIEKPFSDAYIDQIHKINPKPTDKGLFAALIELQAYNQYVLYMINDTDTSFSFNYKLEDPEASVISSHEFRIDRYSFFPIDQWPMTHFNAGYSFQIDVPVLQIQKTHKLKIQKLQKNNQLVPLIQMELPYYIIASAPLHGATSKIELKRKKKSKHKRVDRLQSFAQFNNEIDLHAEQLIENPSECSPKEILDIQLKHLEKYLDKAIGMNIVPVYIIHGIGEGRLKSHIHQYLKRHKYVSKFINEYHEKYGFGATIVYF